MYHPASIAPLSESQITKALKGLPVRVSVGNQHDVELSAQQFKIYLKHTKKAKHQPLLWIHFKFKTICIY